MRGWKLVTASNDQCPDVHVNGIPCSFSRLAEPTHITESGWKQAEPMRQVYSVPMDAIDDGYNLVEVIAKEPVTITWLEISVQGQLEDA